MGEVSYEVSQVKIKFRTAKLVDWNCRCASHVKTDCTLSDLSKSQINPTTLHRKNVVLNRNNSLTRNNSLKRSVSLAYKKGI